jgi:hypothetical protein
MFEILYMKVQLKKEEEEEVKITKTGHEGKRSTSTNIQINK